MLNELYHAIDPVAISIGPFQVYWYGLAYLAGFVLGGLIIWKVAKHWKLNIVADDIFSLITGIAIGVLVGGRLGYVIFYGAGYFLAHPEHIFMMREGGMSFHGGLVGAILGGAVVCKWLKLSFRTFLDLGAIAAPVGLFFGRCANFINGELWGAPTDLPWGVVFQTGGPIPRHPSQLYEAVLEGLVIFCVLIVLAKRVPPRPQGIFIGWFLLLYGVFRFLVEFIRVPDEQLGYLFGWITMGQILSIPLIVLGIVELVLAYRRRWPQEGHLVS